MIHITVCLFKSGKQQTAVKKDRRFKMSLQPFRTAIQFVTEKKLNGRTSIVFALILMLCVLQETQAAPGDLDTSFGNGGKVSTSIASTGGEQINAIAIQSDGKIVAAGYSERQGGADFTLTRYNTNGSLDVSFGTSGIVITPVSPNNLSDSAWGVVIQSDGKIIAAGLGNEPDTSEPRRVAVLVRYNANGSLDTSFGNGGIVITRYGNPLQGIAMVAVALQTNGKIVTAGYLGNFGGSFALARYNTDSSLDTSFGNGGIAITSFAGSASAAAVAVQSDGKIIAAGRNSSTSTGNDFALARYNTDGSLDTSFGNEGRIITAFFSGNLNDSAFSVAIDSNGKIVASGDASDGTANRGLALIRYNTNGTLDSSFGNNGKVFTSGFFGGSTNNNSAMALQSNGKIVCLGTRLAPSPSFNRDFALARYNNDGSLDTSFGSGGRIVTDLNGFEDAPFALAIQSDGKIVAAGRTSFAAIGQVDFAVVRYHGDQTRSTQFDFDGDNKADVSVYRPSNGGWYLLNSSAGLTAAAFGISTDKITPADYDGDGKTDVAVYRDGTWYLQRSQLGFTGVGFGAPTDIPVPADFDGDGKSELAVFRPSNGGWYIYNLATNQASSYAFGINTDVPVPNDYDGDGKADIAVFRSGVWYIQRSQLGFTGIGFGATGDKPVPADYDGDGKTDVAVFRPSGGAWYLLQSTAGFSAAAFGLGTDLPAPADYDGDGKADLAVFREGTWYLNRTTAGFTGVGFGAAGDKPVSNAFIP
jgi:uncharacterized delta-60 repeat protein